MCVGSVIIKLPSLSLLALLALLALLLFDISVRSVVTVVIVVVVLIVVNIALASVFGLLSYASCQICVDAGPDRHAHVCSRGTKGVPRKGV